MTRTTILTALILALLPAVSRASSPTGACSAAIPIGFDAAGGIFQTGAGSARCGGSLGRTSVDPAEVGAFLTGAAAPGPTGCAPHLTRGTLDLRTRRLISFDPSPDVPLRGSWTASAGLVSGSGWADGQNLTLTGAAEFIPASPACALSTFAPGTLELQLVVGDASRGGGGARRRELHGGGHRAQPHGESTSRTFRPAFGSGGKRRSASG